MINIYVQRTLAKACSDAPITSGSVGLTAQFLFSEEWNELTKKAIFETDNYKEPVDVPASGEVIVPESVLVYPWTQLRVGVRGESEDGYVVIPTVYADCGTISLGANTTPVGTPPTPSQAEYLQAQIDELRESGIGGGTTIELDTTLTQPGKAADAKATGDALENVGGKAYVQDTEPAQMEVGEFWYNPDEEGGSIPTTLPNPNKLTFSGAVNAEYDGSEAVEVVIPQGGGSSGGVRLVADGARIATGTIANGAAAWSGDTFGLNVGDLKAWKRLFLICNLGTRSTFNIQVDEDHVSGYSKSLFYNTAYTAQRHVYFLEWLDTDRTILGAMYLSDDSGFSENRESYVMTTDENGNPGISSKSLSHNNIFLSLPASHDSWELRWNINTAQSAEGVWSLYGILKYEEE